MTDPGRRKVIQALGFLGFAPLLATASRDDVSRRIVAVFGGEAREGRVTVKVPPISENGYSVPLSVMVESPMTDADHVVRIGVFAEENPIPEILRVELGPRAGKAELATRIRMAGSQRIRAVAEMSDGSLWTGYAFSVVTLAACVV